MSIPKRPILYQAPRHQNGFSTSIKYGYYSDKMRSSISPEKSTHCKNFGRKYQQKLVQKVILMFADKSYRELETLNAFSRFRSVKKCSLCDYGSSPKKGFATRVLQKVCKTLKGLKRVEFQQMDISDQQNSRTFKPLTLLTSLESLALPHFIYSQNPKTLEPLIQISKLASKRRYWPRFKSLHTDHLYPQGLTLNRENCPPALGSLKSLFKSMKGLGSCEALGKYPSIQLTLPYISSELDCETSLETLSEISREMVCSLTSIRIAELALCSKILEMFQHSIRLKKATFEITEEVKEKVNLDVLNRIPSFQELQIRVRNNKGVSLLSHSDILTQVKLMSSLTAFSFDINGRQRPIEEFNLDLPGVISSLTNLKSLRLSFGRCSAMGGDLDGVWFEDVFKAIGERTALKTLKLSMTHFSFENTRSVFSVFCEPLKRLEQLSDLSLDFTDRKMTIEEKEMTEFCACLSNLRKLEALYFSIVCSKFQPEALSGFLHWLANHLPMISRVSLSFEGVRITSQVYQCLGEIIQKQRRLNTLNLVLIGQMEEGLDLDLVKNEILKRYTGNVLFIPRDG